MFIPSLLQQTHQTDEVCATACLGFQHSEGHIIGVESFSGVLQAGQHLLDAHRAVGPLLFRAVARVIGPDQVQGQLGAVRVRSEDCPQVPGVSGNPHAIAVRSPGSHPKGG